MPHPSPLLLTPRPQVGWTRLQPTTILTQMLFVLFLSIMVPLLPYFTTNLVRSLLSTNRYQRAEYSRLRARRHVVVTGGLTSAALATFLAELYHRDHGGGQIDALLLGPEPPSRRLQLLLGSKEYVDCVQYLQGSPSDGAVRVTAAA